MAVAVALMVLPLSTAASAHEFWLLPTDFDPVPGASVGLRLFVGDGFEQGRAYPRNPAHVRRFWASGAASAEIAGRPGVDPAGEITAEAAGLLTVAYRSHATELTLDAASFESYLRAEGLEHAIEARRATDSSDRPGREAFSRCAKTLVAVGGGPFEGYDQPVGLDLEVVPTVNPLTLGPENTHLPFQVLWKGAPYSGALVRVFHDGRPENTTEIRTDDHGTATAPIDAPGVWMLSVVHIEPAHEGSAVDWESTWSSLTFLKTGESPPLSSPPSDH